MRKPEELNIAYCGYRKPNNLDENKFEILGLKNLIKRAEERISMLEQSSFLAEVALSDDSGETIKEVFDKWKKLKKKN